MKTKGIILNKGDIINDTYDVQFFIGAGAFGEVYRVNHKYLGLQVMKVFKKDYVDNSDLKTITKEAIILSKLTHPNIVRVFETNTFVKKDQRFYFITMGFISGEPLSNLLKRKIQLPLNTALTIQKDFLTGLAVVHNQTPPMIHRDISPDNILLSYDQQPHRAMLSDFGLAQSLDQISQISDAAGKYLYFAPECFWNVYLPASDVFSAGLVFYRMLTGSFPWDYDFEATPDDPEGMTTMVLSARKKPPKRPSFYNDECNEDIEALVFKSLSKEIETRYKNAEEFLKALVAYNKDDIQTQSF